MKRILCIDDHPGELKALIESPPPGIEVDWLPQVIYARLLLEETSVQYDLIIIDIRGTSIDLQTELAKLRHPNVILTSGVPPLQNVDHQFVGKDDLIADIVKRLK